MTCASTLSATWDELVAERARLDVAEDAAADAGHDDEADALQELRHAAEDRLMAMPSPDGAGFALKVLIAIGNGRASIPYQEEIEAEAREMTARAVPIAEQCSRCRFWLIDVGTNDGRTEVQDSDIAFGFCRRNAPVVIGELAALAVPRATWGRDPDPAEELWTTQIYRASTRPATESTDWCGEYAPMRGQ